jgi:hypothetical protein
MRRFVSLLVGLVLVSTGARAQGAIHLVAPGSDSHSPAAPELVARRIATAARRYQPYAPVPRVAFFDIAYPADTSEYRRMAGYALLLVTAISQSPDELPITPYLRTSGGVDQLRPVTSVVGSTQPEDSIVRAVFGRHRIDALYLIPLHPGARGADLFVDFAKNRQGFKLGTVAASLPASLRLAPVPATGAAPDQSTMLNLIRREYPGFVALR